MEDGHRKTWKTFTNHIQNIGQLSIYYLLFLIVFILCNSAFSWEVTKTDHFTVFYDREHEWQAKKFLQSLEYYRPKAEKLTGNIKYHTPVIIEDIGTTSNGMTDPIFNRINLFTYPPSASVLGAGTQSWEADLSLHEYIHLLHLSKVGGIMRVPKALFGNLFMPNLFSLGWVVEGITVYGESQISPYQGRLNDGYYSSYIASRVKDNRFPSILKAAYPPMEYPYLDGIYNYGGMFFDYLAKTYGENKFREFFDRYGSSIPIVMFNFSAKQTYGASFKDLWKDWQQYEYDRFKDFGMEGEKLTDNGWYIFDLAFHNNYLYYSNISIQKTAPFNAQKFAKIIQKDVITGKEKCLISTTSFFPVPMKINENKLYYAIEELKRGYANTTYMGFGFYSVIHEKDLSNGEDKVILKDEVRGFEILNDKTIIYSKDRKDSFGSEIIKYDMRSKEKTKLFDSDYIIDRIVIRGERAIVSGRKDWENYSIYYLNLSNGEMTPIVDTPYFEGHHTFCGNRLFFTANYGGKFAIYCRELSSGKTYRLTKNGYSTNPNYEPESQKLYYIGLNSYGFDIYAKDVEWEEFEIPEFERFTPPEFDIEYKMTKGGYIDNLKTLFPVLHIPSLSIGPKNETRLGIGLVGEDALGHFPYSIDFLYDLDKKEPLFDAKFSVNMLSPFSTTFSAYNKDDKKRFSLDMQYPLLMRLSSGISDLTVGLSGKVFNDSESKSLKRREIAPSINTTFNFPLTTIGLNISTPIERQSVGSRIDRSGIISELRINQYLKKSALRIKTKGIYDPDNTYDPEKDDKEDAPFPVIRGYKDPLDAKIGVSFSADISAPILNIRKGIFLMPYIFFEDVCADVFFDASVQKGGKNSIASTGLELHLETNIAMWIPLDLGIRLVANKDKKYKFEPIISTNAEF
ncbi:TPA: hypothetical protein ENX78_06240 [Candidatus Poribacteria bacterium]|nr:hypothetical protein [Candidatus Poribacteria bacterium]